jgi:flavin-dependent dehydrogenase
MKGRARTAEVAVLGAGPAGVATACALRGLGHTVTLFGRGRQLALEGLSMRALALLEYYGLSHAAACATRPAERGGHWGGAPVSAGHEFIVDRIVFDRALRDDAAAHGVHLEEEFALAIETHNGGYRVRTRSGTHRARVLIDARGRRSGRALARGPSLIALAQRLSAVPAGPPRTLISPLDDGWCWFASDGSGGGMLQLTAASRGLARGAAPAQRLLECLGALAACDGTLRDARPEGEPHARAASARLSAAAPTPGYVRAGDAAVSMEPLSGHGLYEALSWKDAASAAAHTYLDGYSWEPVERFLTERACERWRTGIARAASFYQQQAAVIPNTFWRQSAAAYGELLESRVSAERPKGDWQLRPVLNGSVIEMRRVAVTQERPRGVWQVDQVELARLAEFLLAEPAADVARAAQHLARPPAAVANAVGWLRAHGLLKSGSEAPQKWAMNR